MPWTEGGEFFSMCNGGENQDTDTALKKKRNTSLNQPLVSIAGELLRGYVNDV